MENHLAQPENAIVQYKRVVKDYAGTMYALAASRRFVEVVRSDSVKTDTMKINNNPQIQKPFSPDSVQRNTSEMKKDTLKHPRVSPRNE